MSPLGAREVGTIRCIGLNVSVHLHISLYSTTQTYAADIAVRHGQYMTHAKEVDLPIPNVPVLFMKPSTSLADPYPSPVVIPKAFVSDDAADYESEVALVLGKDCKNVAESEALDYLLG